MSRFTDSKKILKTKDKKPFRAVALGDVASCLSYAGKAKSLAEMNQAIANAVKKQYGS